MRIAIDLQACQTDSRDRGIGRYAMNLVAALSGILPSSDELIICVDAVDTERLRDVRSELRHRGIGGEVVAYDYPCSDFSESSPEILATAGQLRSAFFRSLSPDTLLITSLFEFGTCYSTALDWDLLRGISTTVIAYDLIPLLFPERYLPEGHPRTPWYMEKAKQLKNFDLVFAISERTRADLIELLGIDPLKVKVIGAGLNRTLLGSVNDVAAGKLTQLGIRRPFILTVSNGDWTKNAIGSVHAFADLPKELRRTHQLVLTKVGDDVRRALKEDYRHLRGQVLTLGIVDDEVLSMLYSNCRVFFFPSFYEGFGLPVLEAMATGAATLSSSRGALPEVVHNRAMLFDPVDRAGSATVLRRVLEDDDFRASLKEGAKQHAVGFTWERCAHAALDAIRSQAMLPGPARRTDWPASESIAVMARACQQADDEGEHHLERGLKMIENGDRRRVLVDISGIEHFDLRTGIQRVARNFCVELAAIARETRRFDVEPFVWREPGTHYAREFAQTTLGMECQGRDEEVELRPNDLVFMLDPSWALPERYDEFHYRTWQLGGEVVWMVYDLVPIMYPKTCEPGLPLAFRKWLTYVVRTADGFICDSEATRADLEWFIDGMQRPGRRRPWSRSVHLGCDLDPNFLGKPGESALNVMKKVGGRPYFATLGTLEPRKDYGTVVDAFEKLWSRGADVALVMMGKRGWNIEALAKRIEQHRENGSRLFWLEGIADGDVHHLLKNAAAFIQASVAEGFGLPVVEAGSLGVPLLLSDIPVFHEVAGDDAVYFPVGASEVLSSVIAELLQSNAWKHPKTIKTMTWRESAAKLADVLL